MKENAQSKKDGSTTVTGTDREDVGHRRNESVDDYYQPATGNGDWTFEQQQSPRYLSNVYRVDEDADQVMMDMDHGVQGSWEGDEYPELEGLLGCG